jgi:hypothetical protein
MRRTVVLNEKFNGILMFGAPDIYASSEALIGLLPYLHAKARVVAFGSKLTKRRFGELPNVLVKSLMRFSFASTPKLDYEPWALLNEYCSDIQVQEYLYACFFLFSGSIRPHID